MYGRVLSADHVVDDLKRFEYLAVLDASPSYGLKGKINIACCTKSHRRGLSYGGNRWGFDYQKRRRSKKD